MNDQLLAMADEKFRDLDNGSLIKQCLCKNAKPKHRCQKLNGRHLNVCIDEKVIIKHQYCILKTIKKHYVGLTLPTDGTCSNYRIFQQQEFQRSNLERIVKCMTKIGRQEYLIPSAPQQQVDPLP